MTNFDTPNLSQLPSTKQLNKATGLAAVIAGIILVTTVLPAEFGIDPTGIGKALGLKAMGDMKQEVVAVPVENAATEAPADTEIPSSDVVQTGKLSLTLAPNEGREVKATMKAGEEFDFSWSTDGGQVNYDQHGEAIGAAADEYTSYDKGTKSSASGKFRAPFDGTHGWFWRNRTGKPVTITVTATGQFAKFELKK